MSKQILRSFQLSALTLSALVLLAACGPEMEEPPPSEEAPIETPEEDPADEDPIEDPEEDSTNDSDTDEEENEEETP